MADAAKADDARCRMATPTNALPVFQTRPVTRRAPAYRSAARLTRRHAGLTSRRVYHANAGSGEPGSAPCS